MRLRVASGGICDDSTQPTACDVPGGAPFTLSIDADGIPSGGYIGAITWVDYGPDLAYVAGSASGVWPDCDPPTFLVGNAPPVVNLGCLSGLVAPPASWHVGSLYEVSLVCSSATSTTLVELVAGDPAVIGGPSSKFIDAAGFDVAPTLTSLSITCAPKDPDGDTDGDTIPNGSDPDDDNDGCADETELGTDETLGGRRDPHNPWDFYDVVGAGGGPPDGVVDLPNDILGVIQRFSYFPVPPYDIAFDRGPATGPDPWDMSAPDGTIDLPNDILGVILQFFHDCR